MTADEPVAGVPRLCARQSDCARPRGHDDECGPDRDEVEQFNRLCPVGTPVLYWPGVREGEGRPSMTRSLAWRIGGHTPVVLVEGWMGGIALTHVQPRPQPPIATSLAEAVESLRARLARMTAIARQRGEDVAFADAHIPQWHAIKDERDNLRAEVERLTQDIDECWVPLYHGEVHERRQAEARAEKAEAERDDALARLVEAEGVARTNAAWVQQQHAAAKEAREQRDALQRQVDAAVSLVRSWRRGTTTEYGQAVDQCRNAVLAALDAVEPAESHEGGQS